MKQEMYGALVKLIGEERAKQFADEVDETNREIRETGLISREQRKIRLVLSPELRERLRQGRPIDAPKVANATLEQIKQRNEELRARVEQMGKSQPAEQSEELPVHEHIVFDPERKQFVTERRLHSEDLAARTLGRMNRRIRR